MPCLTKSDPKYRLHKQSRRGRIRIDAPGHLIARQVSECWKPPRLRS